MRNPPDCGSAEAWCITTDPEFGPNTARRGGAVFEPAGENAVVVCCRETAHSGVAVHGQGPQVFMVDDIMEVLFEKAARRR